MTERFEISLGEEQTFDVNLGTEETLNINLATEIKTIESGDYLGLSNKPQINSVVLIGNKSLDDLNIQVKGDYADRPLTNSEIEEFLNNYIGG